MSIKPNQHNESFSINKKQKKLDRNTQQLILENATVNRIKGEVDHVNGFILRSFRLRLEIEEQDKA